MAALHRLTGDEKHGPAAFSTLDVIWVLYDRILRTEVRRYGSPADHERWHGLDPATLRRRIGEFIDR
jgi:transketolase